MDSNRAEQNISDAVSDAYESEQATHPEPEAASKEQKEHKEQKASSPEDATEQQQKLQDQKPPEHIEIEAYWVERKRYLQELRAIPELRKKYLKAIFAYMTRRFLWSFMFFPVFIAFWIPLVLNRFNLVVTIKQVLPSLQAFIEANPQSQAATMETLFIAWISIGITFAIFDFILTPFKNPYHHEADVHMRTWEELYYRRQKKE